MADHDVAATDLANAAADAAPAALTERDHWGSRLGLILAMAGNAVGLGNFLRFPNEAVKAGEGFMAAYFVCLVLLGLPLMWIEWSLGRRGGRLGHSTAPGMFQSLTAFRGARFLGAVGVVMPLLIVGYYVYIESWTLGYAVHAATGELGASIGATGEFLTDYRGADGGFAGRAGWMGSTTAYAFLGVTLLVNLLVLSRGLMRGIEIVAKVGMPLLVLIAVALTARVMTLPETDGRRVVDGLALFWTPDVGRLFAPGAEVIWLAAAGQIFFSLSVGSGAICTYSSYLTDDDDVALTGLTTVSANEFCEVVLGGTLAIPAAYLFFGSEQVQEIAQSSMALAFVTMPEIFAEMPAFAAEPGPASVRVFGTMWFGLLFVAGITSSLALSQPAMAFFQDTLGLSRRAATFVVGAIVVLCVQPVVLVPGVLEEIDYWAGTFGLVAFSLVEVVLLMWVFGSRRAWDELHTGADIRVPGVFRFVMTWVTPLMLIAMLGFWGWNQALPILSLEEAPGGGDYTTATRAGAWIARGTMLAVLALVVTLIGVASWRGRFDSVMATHREEEQP